MGKKIGRRWRGVWLIRRLRIVLLILAGWAIIHLAYVTIDGLSNYHGKADIAVVLGNRVEADGTLSPVLQGRVDKALQLYREKKIPRIMVSGGRGEKGEDPPKYPEGKAMKEYLVAKGVPANAIIEDNNGEDTYLTAKDYLKTADSLKLSSAIVVSSFYHITRTKYIFRKLGARNVHSASSDSFFWNDLFGLPRDCIAFYKYLIVY